MSRRIRPPLRSPVPFRVSLPGFILLTTSVFLFVGLGALVAGEITGRTECVRIFFHGTGALLLIALATFEISLARMVLRQFSEGEPLRPAWFLIMLAGGCHLAGTVCGQVLGGDSLLNLPASGAGTWLENNATAISRFGLIVGGPLHVVLLAAGLFFLLRLCWESRIAVSVSSFDCSMLLLAFAGAYAEVSSLAAGPRAGSALTAYDVLQVSRAPLLVILVVEAMLVKRCMSALGGGMVAKCWTAITAAVYLMTLANVGQWASASGLLPASLEVATWCIWFLSATAYALGPAWQIEAIQSACGEVGVARFSPFASSLRALRLINRTN